VRTAQIGGGKLRQRLWGFRGARKLFVTQVGAASRPAKTLLRPNFAIATNKYSMMRL
jgi:hypothetical protein